MIICDIDLGVIKSQICLKQGEQAVHWSILKKWMFESTYQMLPIMTGSRNLKVSFPIKPFVNQSQNWRHWMITCYLYLLMWSCLLMYHYILLLNFFWSFHCPSHKKIIIRFLIPFFIILLFLYKWKVYY